MLCATRLHFLIIAERRGRKKGEGRTLGGERKNRWEEKVSFLLSEKDEWLLMCLRMFRPLHFLYVNILDCGLIGRKIGTIAHNQRKPRGCRMPYGQQCSLNKRLAVSAIVRKDTVNSVY